ncbi:MAG: hypothetical protein LUC88_02625 [Prevotella sp.]|nr:hypothetical protein [Prevotella sp.]
MATNKQQKQKVETTPINKDEVWTPEAKAEFRKLMPKKLNKLGEWFFSEEGGKEYLIIVDEKAVLK